MDTESKKTTGPKDLKKEGGLSSMEIPMRNTSAGGRKLQCTDKRPGCDQQTCCCNFSQRQVQTNGEKPARGKKPWTSLLGVSGTDTPLQGGASISGLLGHLVSEVGGSVWRRRHYLDVLDSN
jgi:hypothetical protein